jgi:nucleotide-binding universal stress UspA family protein
MEKTLICTLDEGPAAAATAAFGVWLGEHVGARPFVCRARSTGDVLAVAAEHRARIVVTSGVGEAPVERALELSRGLEGSLVLLPRDALELWLDPSEARRRAGRGVVAGSDGSAASIEAARVAGRIAAGLGGRTLVAHARPRHATGTPSRSPGFEPDPIAQAELAARRSLVAPALAAAAAHGAAVEARLPSAGVVEALTDLAAGERAPLIAVGTGRPSRARPALGDSVTAELIERTERPLLIATLGPPRDRADGDDRVATTDFPVAPAAPAPAPAVGPLHAPTR